MQHIAARIGAMVFLATPHRGSDLAGTLLNILKFTYGPKPYVSEITRNSTLVTSINDTFRHVSAELRLHSFYETQAVTKLWLRKIIVEKDSAILGYCNEQPTPLNADHRSICKFESTSDPNYRTVRNILSSCVDEIAAKGK